MGRVVVEVVSSAVEDRGNLDLGGGGDGPRVECGGHGHHLAGAARLVDVGNRPVTPVGRWRLGGVTGVERRVGGQRQHLAGPGIHRHHCAAVGVGLDHLAADGTLGDELNVTIDGELHVYAGDRLLRLRVSARNAASAGGRLVRDLTILSGQLPIPAVLQPGQTVAVTPDKSEQGRTERTLGIDPLGRRLAVDAREPQRLDLTPGTGRDLLGDVRKAEVAVQETADGLDRLPQHGSQCSSHRHRISDLRLVSCDIDGVHRGRQRDSVGVGDRATSGWNGDRPQPLGFSRCGVRRGFDPLQLQQSTGEQRHDDPDQDPDGNQTPTGVSHAPWRCHTPPCLRHRSAPPLVWSPWLDPFFFGCFFC